ncbi:MAG TPA: retropepsin-like aspartic protease [Rhizomicrobium sp.]|nr:retropepsin-like aspartic protease [Rhizomicrobium sp.]
MTRKIWIVLAFLASGGAFAAADRLWPSYLAQDFFALRAELGAPTARDSGNVQFLRAATLAAFGRTADSARMLDALIARPLADHALEERARELLMLDRRAQFQYAAALRAISPLLGGNSPTAATRLSELRNRARLLDVIADVPPQTVRRGAGTAVAMDAGGRVRILLGRGAADMAIDTGANLSVISHSAAVGLGFKIRPAGYAIGSSMGGAARADIAVIDFAFADATHVANAVFLVLPDRALTMANGQTADGLIGLPVIAALGAIEYRGGRVAFNAAAIRGGASAELALAGSDPLLRVSYRGRDMLCRLDTGAERSIFYEPFYRQFRDTIAPARNRSVRIGGATGTRSFDTRDAGPVDIAIAGRAIRLGRATILTEPLRGTTNAALACQIGRDALARLPYYTIDLTQMRLTLG